MDALTLSGLEYDALKGLIAPFVRTAPGRRALDGMRPETDPAAVSLLKTRAAEALRHHVEGGRLGPGSFDDPGPALDRVAPAGVVLDPLEILRLVALAQAADALREEVHVIGERFPHLWRLASEIPDLRGLTRGIAGKIASDGRLEDTASPDLARLRRRITEIEATLQRSLQAILDTSADRGWLQDTFVTVRNGRFVIPVRAESRSSVPGIVHGSSSTGATLFVEPLATLEINNELVTLRDAEQAEIRRLLTEWSDQLRARRSDLLTAADRVARLDLLGAVAVFGVSCRAVVAGDAGVSGRPARIVLQEARHPVLEAGLRGRDAVVVPLTVTMDSAGGALILSGPNAGGKTVALKTIGLLCLMNQSGLPVPAADAVLPVFRQIVADIGDHQSILESLSTFSARMARVSRMSRALTPPALVLLDEVGAGTDPEEAGALAVAIVDHFGRRGAAVVATTHHESLKAWAGTAPGAVNAAMEIDEATMRPTYRIQVGMAGRSGGIDLAARMGLPEELVADARSRLSEGHREARDYAAKLQRMVEEGRREQELLRAGREELERERRTLREQAAATVASLKAAWQAAIDAALARIEEAREQLLSTIEDRATALQLRAESRRQSRTLREQLEATLRPPSGEPAGKGTRQPAAGIGPGARVRLRGLAGGGEVATVESVDARGRAEVTVRGKRLTVPVGDLDPLETPAAPARPGWSLPQGVRFERESRDAVAAELHLIGATVEEALDRLDKYLDEAWLAGHREVRVVHGHGTGRLRAAIHAHLSGHPHVASHAPAERRAGGTGATVVSLKD